MNSSAPTTSSDHLSAEAAVEPWSRDWEAEARLYREEMRRRISKRRNAGADVEQRAVILAKCKRDFITFVNDWCFTYDPRAKRPLKKKMPFKMWPKQVELAQWLIHLHNTSQSGVLKKSRDLGATWECGVFGLWLWLFHEDESITFGSRKQDLVDRKGDPDSIFEKLRIALDELPEWFLPPGFDTKKHDNHMRLINPYNGSVITGEVGDQMGRGGRSSMYFADEFAFVARADKVRGAIGDNADSIVFLSTSNGMGTAFHQLEQEGMLPFFKFHWTDDPRKTEGWKQSKIAQIGITNFNREHEQDDSGAMDFAIIEGAWARAAQEIELTPGTSCSIGLDIADTGNDDTVLTPRWGSVVEKQLTWKEEINSALMYAVADVAFGFGARELYYDHDGPGAGFGATFDVMGVSFKHEGIVNGARASEICYRDAPDLPAHERFANRVTELWWALRLRFIATYERSLGIRNWPDEDCISIDADDYELLAQLCSRKYERTSNGKIKLESKAKMRKERGIKSPDKGDSLAYAFATPLEQSSHTVLERTRKQFGFLGV